MEGSEMNKTCTNTHSKKLDTKQIANAIGIFQCSLVSIAVVVRHSHVNMLPSAGSIAWPTQIK